MPNGHFLEALNGTLMVLLIGLMLLFGRYIVIELVRAGWAPGRRNRTAAISVFTFLLGDFIIRTNIWLWRHLENRQMDIAPYKDALLIGTVVGAVVSIFGGICIARHFAPDRWKQWPWIIITTAALAFGIGAALL